MLRLQILLYDIRATLRKVIFARRNPPLASLVFHLLLLFFFGLITYSASVALTQRRFLWWHLLLYAASLSYLFLVPRFIVSIFLPINFRSILGFWLFTIPLAPLGGFAMFSWNRMSGLFAKRTIETEQEDKMERRRVMAQERENHARRKALLEPQSSVGYLNVGAKSDGEDFPSHIGIEEHGGWIHLKNSLLFQHAFVVGTTGAGKTELLIRLIYETLRNTRMRIYVIDGKGDLEFAKKVATLAYQHGRGPTPIFMMGQTSQAQENSAIYDGFLGDRDAIANRLSMMMAVDKAVGNAQHYTETYKGLMHLICGVGYPQLDIKLPRDFDEVLDRLNFAWLMKTYKKFPREIDVIRAARGVKENLIAAASSRLANLARPLEGAVGHKGFSLEDSHCAIFSLRTQSVGADAKKFLEFLIEDVKDWVGKRQPPGVEALLIIDEFGTFSNESITDILTLARSSKVGVILAAQDVAQLGSDRVKRQILATCNTYFLMKTNFPEELVDLAGTIYAVEPSYQLENGMPTGMQSARIQHQFKIPPNDVAQLTPGQCYIINSRYAVKVHTSTVEGIQINPEAIAAKAVEKEEADKAAHEVNTENTETASHDDEDGFIDIPA